MSDIHIIGTLCRVDAIEEAALHYLKLGYSVSIVRRQPNKSKEELIIQCFDDIRQSSEIVAVPHADGSFGEGTQYEIAFAKFLGRRVRVWQGGYIDKEKSNEQWYFDNVYQI